ncbi:MAG: GTP cyclohydrolase II [Alphaproteobacteria bacterium]|nr:GTP cyclohydrolase II [Alphaproteobacteria bacterium]
MPMNKDKTNAPKDLLAVETAVDALRAGAPVTIRGKEARLAVLAAELLDDSGLTHLRKFGRPDLVLTHRRAATLKMRLYTPEAVALASGTMTAVQLRQLADPADDMANPLRGPFMAKRTGVPEGARHAVKLVKLAGLLPAALVVPLPQTAPDQGLPVSFRSIEAYDVAAATNLRKVSEARVPLAGATQTRVAAFRPSDGGPEHLAIIIGNPSPPGPVLVRLHSECFTGDLLGSLKCDCGEQLKGAIAQMGRAGEGILLYLAQEGRGIGLMNKLRAYALQDQGFDTMEANTRLGFEEDERLFEAAAVMLRQLGFSKIRLLTNNPAKVESLQALGLEVAERVAHAFPANPHNAHYLEVKRAKGGHHL